MKIEYFFKTFYPSPMIFLLKVLFIVFFLFFFQFLFFYFNFNFKFFSAKIKLENKSVFNFQLVTVDICSSNTLIQIYFLNFILVHSFVESAIFSNYLFAYLFDYLFIYSVLFALTHPAIVLFKGLQEQNEKVSFFF